MVTKTGIGAISLEVSQRRIDNAMRLYREIKLVENKLEVLNTALAKAVYNLNDEETEEYTNITVEG